MATNRFYKKIFHKKIVHRRCNIDILIARHNTPKATEKAKKIETISGRKLKKDIVL